MKRRFYRLRGKVRRPKRANWRCSVRAPIIKVFPVPPPVVVYLSDEECRDLLAGQNDLMTYTMILTALHTGMRLGELCALSWEDIDFRQRILTVRHSMVRGIMSSPKSNKIRHIPLSQELATTLGGQQRPNGLVFQDNGKPISDYAAEQLLTKACARAGIRRVSWHKLRHTFATQLAGRKVPLRAIQLLLGHSTIQMTERYAHFAESSLSEAISVLDEPGSESLGNRRSTLLVEQSNEIGLVLPKVREVAR